MIYLPSVISLLLVGGAAATLPDQRPAYDKRTFHSTAIDNLINTLQPLFADENLGILFANTLPNTLDTTVYYYTPNPETVPESDLDTFVITGDINALWLRDSMNQVLPYIPYGPQDQGLTYMLEGLINRHAHSVIIDPFANSFNYNASREGHQSDDVTPPMGPLVFESKYEIDSLAAFLKLSYWHYRYSGEAALLRFADDNWLTAVDTLLTTVNTMQLDTGRSSNPPYLFRRVTSEGLDTNIIQGRGPPANPNGLTRSLFRPSDDAVTLPYNIPGNAMICVELNHLYEMLNKLNSARKNKTFKSKVGSGSLSDLIDATHAILSLLCTALEPYTAKNPNVMPYEVDGWSSQYFMDDANVPSLLSLPVLGYMSASNAVYQRTRNYVLSTSNPYYFVGSAANGIGGPHVGFNMSWPMAITMRAMTSTDDKEIQECLNMLLTTTAGTGLMHESFNVSNPDDYTRSWFAWANGLFGEMILQLINTKPELVLKNDPQTIATAQSVVKPTVSLTAQSEVLVK